MMKILFISMLVALAATGMAQQKARLTIGDDAPAFNVGYWLKGDPGKGVEQGKVSVVEFWATWCAPCIANFPHLAKLAEKHKSKGVKVFGISINERKGVGLDSLQKFMAGPKAKVMNYIVGADDTSSKYMATNWAAATGQRGIPFAMIVDRNGKIAWMGHPAIMDKALEQIVNGSWNLASAKAKFIEDKRLDSIDGSIITRFNKFLTEKRHKDGLIAIDSLLNKEPALKYRFYTAHYTFVCLFNTEPEKSIAFAREAWKANDFPNWKGVSDIVLWSGSRNMKLPVSVYALGADALQAQIDHYPWSMNTPDVYNNLAEFHYLAGNKAKSIEAQKKAIALANESPDRFGKLVPDYELRLKRYEGS